MPAPSQLSPRARRLAAGLIHKTWEWVGRVGTIGPDDALGRRFGAMGWGSAIAFPPGVVFGERWIRIGADTLIGPHVGLSVGLDAGDDMAGADGAVVMIGDRCTIGRGSAVVARCRVEIGDDVSTGPNVYITDHNHTYADPAIPIGRQWPAEDPVRIGSGSWLGAGVIVLPGADIGCHVTVGAGSVVRGIVPDHSVVAGSPARVVRRFVDGQGWVPALRPQVVRPPVGWVAT